MREGWGDGQSSFTSLKQIPPCVFTVCCNTLPHHYVHSQWGQQEPTQGRHVVQPYETNATDTVSLDLVHGEQANCEDTGDAPGTGVEEEGLLLYRLTAPLGDSSQEPGDGENDPPDAAGHGEEIQHHEEKGAGLGQRENVQVEDQYQYRGSRRPAKNTVKKRRSYLIMGALGHR